MPTYAYVCPKGHEHDRFFNLNSDKVRTSKCPQCSKRAIYSIAATHRRAPNLITDVQEWEKEVPYRGIVKSRRHWRDLQKRFGFTDYERVRSKSSDWKQKPAQAIKNAQEAHRRAERYGGGWNRPLEED